MLVAGTLAAQDDTSAEMPTFSKKHGLYKNAFALYITPSVSGRTIYYTKDGSVPTRESIED